MPTLSHTESAAQIFTTADSSSQRTKILDLLLEAHGDWVPLPAILPLASQYSARICELRKLGYRIENRIIRSAGKPRSWFRLVAETLRSQTTQANPSPVEQAQGELFPAAEYQQYRDPEENRK